MLGRLYWGANPASGRAWAPAEIAARASVGGAADDVGRQTKRVLQVAEETLGAEVPVVAAIDREGVLATDPRYRASDSALAAIDRVYLWAMCGRVAAEPLAGRCRVQATVAIDRWTSIYRPTGNPINDSYLVTVLQAIDLTAPAATEAQRMAWAGWAIGFARQGDAFYGRLPPTDGRIINNWTSWRLLLRGLGGAVGGDATLVTETRTMMIAHVAQNLRASGASRDFEERDALHYHTYDLLPLVTLALFVPETVDASTAAAIEAGLQFLRPFVLREQSHIEFRNTTVAFDRQRRDAGIAGYANAPWDPTDARELLRLARTRFAAIRSWTQPLVDEQYSPRVKQIAALRGA